jgi:hypothetical protein
MRLNREVSPSVIIEYTNVIPFMFHFPEHVVLISLLLSDFTKL